MLTVEVDASMRQALLDAGLLVELGAEGLYARSAGFEAVVSGVSANVREGFGDPAPIQLALPWVVPAGLLVESDYLRAFPDLSGRVFGFAGDDRAHARLLAALESGNDYADELTPTDVALCSAGCHPLYPVYAGWRLPAPLRLDAVGHCFRNEPSRQPGRMRAFRQHEQVCVAVPEIVEEHRLRWLNAAEEFFAELDLPVRREAANDPFFGRVGKLLARGQRDGDLKHELVADIGGRDVAIASGNNHQDHFTAPFDIAGSNGESLHSSCIGFGLERVALALLSRHGLDLAAWPAPVRSKLSL